ncbi:myc proto-oncogene protein-like [Centruroides vittatus]|uniref:myc proto-oncogene protein-like n=1 Tax=Centruroides vittatus TaxID=120091 RepID=UPI00350EE987
MAPVPDLNGDGFMPCSASNSNCLLQDAILNDPEQRDEELFELSREIRINTPTSPIPFEGSYWNENPNLVDYASEDLITEIIDNNAISTYEMDINEPDIPTIKQEHSYSQNPDSPDSDSTNNDEELESLDTDEENETLDVDEIEIVDIEKIDDDDDLDSDRKCTYSMRDHIFTAVSVETNWPRRNRPKYAKYAGSSVLKRDSRGNSSGKHTKSKKKIDESIRALHNTKERDRRHALKRDVASLAEEIPNLPSKRPMNLVLKRALEYIKKLKKENKGYQEQLRTIKKSNSELYKSFTKSQRTAGRK